MNNEKSVPKLRFSGFTDEWKEVKLGEISTFLDNKRIPLKEDDRKHMQGEYPYYGASGIIDYVNDYIFDETVIEFFRYKNTNQNSYYNPIHYHWQKDNPIYSNSICHCCLLHENKTYGKYNHRYGSYH